MQEFEVYTECVVCGCDIHFGEEAYQLNDDEDAYICFDEECLKDYALDNLDPEIDLDEEYTIIDYALDFLVTSTEAPTKREYDIMIEDLKAEEKILRRQERREFRRDISA